MKQLLRVPYRYGYCYIHVAGEGCALRCANRLPSDHQSNLASGTFNVGHYFLNQCAHNPLFDACIRMRTVPDLIQLLSPRQTLPGCPQNAVDQPYTIECDFLSLAPVTTPDASVVPVLR